MAAPITPWLTLPDLLTSTSDAVRPDRGDRRNDRSGRHLACSRVADSLRRWQR
jgi:hypothetical protein